MAVKIRFARIGKTHAPVYRIVAVDSRKKRDGKYLENLGTYNPLTKELIQFHDERLAYWVSVGAIVTESVQRLIKINNKKQAEAKKAVEKKEVKKAESKAKATSSTKTAPKKATTAKKTASKAKSEK